MIDTTVAALDTEGAVLRFRSRHWDVFFCLALAVGVLFLFRDASFGQSSLSVQNADNRELVFPFFSYWIDSLKQDGALDPWNPYIWGGMPAIGNPNVPLNPVLYLFLHLGQPRFILAMNWHLILELVLGAMGFYFLADRLGYGKLLSALGGFLYVASTSATVTLTPYSTFFHFVVIPWVLFLLLTHRRRSTVKNVLVLSGVFYYQLTYGQLQLTLYTFYFLILVVFWLLREEFDDRARIAAILALGYLSGLVLASHYLLPMFEFVWRFPERTASDWRAFVAIEHCSWRYVLNLLLPELFWSAKTAWWPPGWSQWEGMDVYTAPVYSVLFFFGLRRAFFRPRNAEETRLRRWAIFAIALVLLNITNVGGLVLVGLNLGKELPFARSLHFLLFPLLFIALGEIRTILHAPRALAGFLITLGILLLALRVFREEPLLRAYVHSFFVESDQRVPGALKAFPEFWSQHRELLAQKVQAKIWQLSGLLAFGLTLYLLYPRRRLRFVMVGMIVLASFIPLLSYQSETRPQGEDAYPFPSILRKSNPILDYLRHQDLSLYVVEYYLKERNHDIGLVPNENAIYKVPAINGYTSIAPRRNGLEPSFFRVNMGYPYSETLLKLLSIKYVVLNAGLNVPVHYVKRMKPLLRIGAYFLLEYEDAMPKIYFPRAIRRVPARELVARLKAPSLDPREISFVPDDALPADYRAPAGCAPGFRERGRHLSSRTIEFQNPCGVDVRVGLNVPTYPWWKLVLDGQPAAGVSLNLLHRSLLLPPGDHTLEIRCVPASFYLGLAVSAAAILIWLGLGAGLAWRGLPL